VILYCDQDTTLEDFGENILIHDDDSSAVTTPRPDSHLQNDSLFASDATRRRRLPHVVDPEDEKRIADVIIARDLHLAPQQVQIQALEAS
jgi:hypothetical protein